MIQFFLAAFDTEEDLLHFNWLYSEYEPKMRRYARFILKSDEKVDDVLQNSFAKIICAYDVCRRKKGIALEKWLIVIVRNTIRDMWRIEAHYNALHHSQYVTTADDEDDYLDSLTAVEFYNARNHPQDEILDQMQYKHLTKLILSMPELYANILEKSLILGMSNRSIADSLKIPENTVATRLRRGRELLIKELEKEGISYDRT